MPGANYTAISQRTNTYAEAKMLDTAAVVTVLNLFGDTKPLPKNKADNIKFRRPNLLAPATTPLTESVSPTTKPISYSDVSVQIQQYGDIIEITDKIADLCEDPVLNDACDIAGKQIADTMEAVCYGVLKAGTSVYYVNGAARNAVNTPITLNKLRAVVRFLQSNRSQPVTKMLDASPNYATRGIEAAYIAFCHTDVSADVRNLAGFVPVASYGNRKPVSEFELGTVENVRFIASPMLTPWADTGGAKGTMKSTSGTSADVYPIIVVGQSAYAHVPLKGRGAVEPKIINPDQIDKSDILGQKGYVGWKGYYASVILNQLWLARVETAVTDL
ncbi:major capsid protein, N4-gp56 family [Andreprevotia lacus DSM 23236]|jgi:N4-gp56 family major capsid protein|uniref:Major capsid protein, N4-gp56 family n=1 Tax=Andreprevotia lacus DSM 23236 TaxID=1121001 RepID=A0A1W1XTL5_9NEIS|nr:N4-gp56 family major capsid protein [Andreprevotia lacus]SMC27226.1 major capsid protein, N4-gp56 family [Andreprevotia lacus DSM 23236]